MKLNKAPIKALKREIQVPHSDMHVGNRRVVRGLLCWEVCRRGRRWPSFLVARTTILVVPVILVSTGDAHAPGALSVGGIEVGDGLDVVTPTAFLLSGAGRSLSARSVALSIDGLAALEALFGGSVPL